ncbi:hypothetical protein PA598K_04974 [Paenibacillus sp. 598K]|uniref:alpha/beta hydrolase family protein n=1 Tax=Paenibacillus sp. 598K TaxID=1117987 RepID=UPI000FF93EB2|nr:hypothetical protein [Paenibacillus sp. 598K]GBF76500.1 hypothetical protein PA598K_04974 [Paenibacillus sp. 598K]
MIEPKDNLYQEADHAGNEYRERQYGELNEWIEAMQRESAKRRARYYSPDYTDCEAYVASTERYREDFAAMLGLPLPVPINDPEAYVARREEARYEKIAEDRLGDIYRVTVPVHGGLQAYGLFFRPVGDGPFPLVISQHGGQGTPEMTAGFFDSTNYNDMTRRILRRGAAVFAPQLLLWEGGRFGPVFDRTMIDVKLKQLGSSITAVELVKIRHCLDSLLLRPDIDGDRIGMMGLSYGGFYTLCAAALDARISVAISSCYVNDRFAYGWSDWTWTDSANRFLDAEICGLVCPRPLYLEGGSHDAVFATEGFIAESERAKRHYERLGIAERFHSDVFEGGHELNPEDEPLDFLFRHL